MSEEYPIRVGGPDGETVAACHELKIAIGLVCASGSGATIWVGIRNPQKIYTLTESHARVGDWYGLWFGRFDDDLSLAVEIVAETLYPNRADLESIYKQKSGCLDDQWWEGFQRYVAINGDRELKERQEGEELVEMMQRRFERGKEEVEEDEWVTQQLVTLRNSFRNEPDEGSDDDLPTLPPTKVF